MKRTSTKIPPQLTSKEKELLNICIRIGDWHLATFFRDQCHVIGKYCIGWKREGKRDEMPIWVYIYGLNAITTNTGQPIIANFFIHYQDRVYQELDIEGAIEIKNLIKKELIAANYNRKIRCERQSKQNNLEINNAA